MGQTWNEAVEAFFKTLHHHFPGGATENYKNNLSQDSQCPGRDSNMKPSK